MDIFVPKYDGKNFLFVWEDDFSNGGFHWLLPNEAEKNLVAFERISLKGECVRVVISFSGSAQEVFFSLEADKQPIEMFCTQKNDDQSAIVAINESGYLLGIPPFGGIVLRHESKIKTFRYREN